MDNEDVIPCYIMKNLLSAVKCIIYSHYTDHHGNSRKSKYNQKRNTQHNPQYDGQGVVVVVVCASTVGLGSCPYSDNGGHYGGRGNTDSRRG